MLESGEWQREKIIENTEVIYEDLVEKENIEKKKNGGMEHKRKWEKRREYKIKFFKKRGHKKSGCKGKS